ncbi:MAG: hypothetical protein H7833_19340, partial [Magnetococcus sp. DMHC-1]
MSETETVTVNDVWKAFLETDRRMQKMQEMQAETDRIIRENSRAMREMKAETDRVLRENSLAMREMNAETDRKMQETDRKMQETDRTL